MKLLFRFFFITVLFAGAAAAGIFLYGKHQFEAAGPLEEEVQVVIPRGSGLRSITEQLAAEGVVEDPLVAALGARASGLAGRLQAGEYAFPPGVSAREALEIIASGQTVVRRLTIAEGLTVAQIVGQINAAEGLTGEIEELPPEGSLLPETYHYRWGDDRAAVLERMRRSMERTLEELWQERAGDLPISTPEEAVTLASIVEKETGVAAERPLVASVFVNRLRRGMRLQSDPTVIYALTEGISMMDRALTRADWQVQHPYNTYQIDGLPPGPIANPGRESVAAVLQPESSDYYYFVADGTGGHAFARTLEEHNRNVAAWRRIRDGGN